MTLEEFEAEIRADVDRFVANWRSQSARDPDYWPAEMEPGEWNEQWIAWRDDYMPDPEW